MLRGPLVEGHGLGPGTSPHSSYFLAAKMFNQEPREWDSGYGVEMYRHSLTVLSGMTYMEHLRDNIRSLETIQVLEAREHALLEEGARILLDYPLIPCNGWQYCMPCP